MEIRVVVCSGRRRNDANECWLKVNSDESSRNWRMENTLKHRLGYRRRVPLERS